MQDSALMIPVRLSYYSGKETSTYLAQEHAHKYIQNSLEDVSVHELCETEGAYYRFFMDIDKPKDKKKSTTETETPEQVPTPEDDKKKVIDIDKITKKIVELMLSIYNFNAKLTIIQRSDGAQSWHVYGNFACTIRTMKYLTKHVSKYIDKQVYKNNTSL